MDNQTIERGIANVKMAGSSRTPERSPRCLPGWDAQSRRGASPCPILGREFSGVTHFSRVWCDARQSGGRNCRPTFPARQFCRFSRSRAKPRAVSADAARRNDEPSLAKNNRNSLIRPKHSNTRFHSRRPRMRFLLPVRFTWLATCAAIGISAIARKYRRKKHLFSSANQTPSTRFLQFLECECRSWETIQKIQIGPMK